MAILVTGAGGMVGRAAVGALMVQGVEQVRALVRHEGQAGALRQLGAKVAVMDALDPDGLEAVMQGVFTAVCLTGSLWAEPGEDLRTAVVEATGVLLEAARRAGVRRVVVLSPQGAGAGAANPYLAAKGEAEAMVAASGLEYAILRCTHVIGPGSRLLAHLRRVPVVVPGTGRQRVAPVYVGDVARAIAAADDAVELRATWSLAGPSEVTLDELADRVHGGPVPKRHTAEGADPDGLTPTQLDFLARDCLPDPSLPAPPGPDPTPLPAALAASA